MWTNDFTGEVYNSLIHAMITIIHDMVKCRNCRTIKMLSIRKYNPTER